MSIINCSPNSEDPTHQVELFCGSIQRFLKTYNKIGTQHDTTQLRNELGKMREEIKELDQSISRKIKTYKSTQASPDFQFNLMVNGFTRASETWRTLYRESIKREKLTQTCNQVAIETDPSVIAQKFAKMEGKHYASKEDALRDYLCDRENEARLIREESQAIAELFQLSAKMMAEQQENLETIDSNIATAESETNQAVITLSQAAKLNSDGVVYKGAIVGGVMFGAVGFLLGPIGSVVAGSAGAWAGTKIGKAYSQLSNSVLDKELFEYHMKRKWIADELVSQCMHCAASFTFFLRKHHCRACGQVFCYSCCFKLLPFKFQEMETERMEKVCTKCYNIYWESPDSY